MNEDLTIKAISTYNANLHRGMTAALEAVVAMALEEAARVAQESVVQECCGNFDGDYGSLLECCGKPNVTPMYPDEIAAAIRALIKHD